MTLMRYRRTFHLSTHDLTRRSTGLKGIGNLCIVLSTHDLTRRSTLVDNNTVYFTIPFNSRPHTEVDVSIPDSHG